MQSHLLSMQADLCTTEAVALPSPSEPQRQSGHQEDHCGKEGGGREGGREGGSKREVSGRHIKGSWQEGGWRERVGVSEGRWVEGIEGREESKGGSWKERRKECERSSNVTRTCFL